MHLHYFQSKHGNFGDDLNIWIWDFLLPGWQKASPNVYLIGVGTLLNENRLRGFRKKEILVLGSGVGYGQSAPLRPFPPMWDFRAVRGPLSASALGLAEQIGIIDPAALLPDIPEFQGIRRGGPPVFVPHHLSVKRHDWKLSCEKAEMLFVSPEDDSKAVIRKIASAPLVIAEAMRAAIIADAFGVPWVPVQIGSQFNTGKWNDWCASLDLSVIIPPMFPFLDSIVDRFAPRRGQRMQLGIRQKIESQILGNALKTASRRKPALSCRAILEEKKTRFKTILDKVVEDYEIYSPLK